MITLIKDNLRRIKHRLIGEIHSPRWAASAPSVKASQLLLLMQYRSMIAQGIAPKVADTGMRVFSGTDDDGILLYIFSAIGFKSRICVDIGAGDGISNNCTNLILNFGFRGLLIDGDQKLVSRGQTFLEKHPDTSLYPPRFIQAFVTAENCNELVAQESISGEIDLLSIDIDGNDFWVWKSLNQVQPRVVIIETHIEFGKRNMVVPYDPKYCYPGRHPQYHGASPAAMIELGRQKGYRLVATNNYGFNFVFVKYTEDAAALPTLSIEEALSHPRNNERTALVKEIETWEYTTA